MSDSSIKTYNGWRIYMLPAMAQTLTALTAEVERLSQQNPDQVSTHPKAKLLARLLDVMQFEVPKDPTHKIYRQGTTLGSTYKDWSRAKFLGRFRLFFRFSTKQKMIIYCWVNDENTLRKAGSSTDPYTVFAKMLASGNPPNDWDELQKIATEGAKGK